MFFLNLVYKNKKLFFQSGKEGSFLKEKKNFFLYNYLHQLYTKLQCLMKIFISPPMFFFQNMKIFQNSLFVEGFNFYQFNILIFFNRLRVRVGRIVLNSTTSGKSRWDTTFSCRHTSKGSTPNRMIHRRIICWMSSSWLFFMLNKINNLIL